MIEAQSLLLFDRGGSLESQQSLRPCRGIAHVLAHVPVNVKQWGRMLDFEHRKHHPANVAIQFGDQVGKDQDSSLYDLHEDGISMQAEQGHDLG